MPSLLPSVCAGLRLPRPCVLVHALMLVAAAAAFAPQWLRAQAPVPVRTGSPRATIETFLATTQPDRPLLASAAYTLHAPNLSRRERGQRALLLRQTLDGMGLTLDPADAPDEVHADTVLSYVPFRSQPSIRLERYGNAWRFSDETVAAVPRLHRRVYPFGTNGLIRHVPPALTQVFLGLYWWQWIGLGVLLLLGTALFLLLKWLAQGVVGRILRRWERLDLLDRLVRPSAERISLLVVLAATMALLPLLQLPAGLQRWLMTGLRVLIPFYVVLVIYKVIDVGTAYWARRNLRQGTAVNAALIPLLGSLLKIFVVVTGVLLVLQNLEFNVTTLVAGLSIGGLALALAAQDTLKNFFGSIMILLDRPFQIGDFIIFQGMRGIVQNVGLRATRIRTFDNSILYVPNAKLSDSVVENMGLRQYQRYLLDIGLAYGTAEDQIEAFCTHLRKWIETHPRTRKDFYQVFFHEYAASALVVRVNLHMDAREGNAENEVRHAFNLFILRTARALGIELAYPTQTLYLARATTPDSHGPLPPLPGSWPPDHPTQDHPGAADPHQGHDMGDPDNAR